MGSSSKTLRCRRATYRPPPVRRSVARTAIVTVEYSWGGRHARGATISAKSTTGTTIHARMRLRNRTPMRSRSAAGHRASLATSRTGGRAASAFAVSGATWTRRLSRSRTLFGTPLPISGSPTRDFRGAAAVVGSRTSVMTEHPTRRRNFHSRQSATILDKPSKRHNIGWPPVQPTLPSRVHACCTTAINYPL